MHAIYLLCVLAVPLLPLAAPAACTAPDWLVCAPTTPPAVASWTDGSISGITLSNTLISRSWVLNASGVAAFGLLDFRSELDEASWTGAPGAGVSLLQALTPEAILTLNGTSVSVGGLATSARGGSPNFTLVGVNEYTTCSFVAQGPTGSLDTCLAACFADGACNIVDWIPPSNSTAADCVFKNCPTPLAPSLAPYAGCYVYATDVAPESPAPPIVTSGPFLNRTLLSQPGVLIPLPGALVFTGYTVGAPTAAYNWTAGKRGSPAGLSWPPAGIALQVAFTGAPGSVLAGIDVRVSYEMYTGSPSMTKWVTVARGDLNSGVTLNSIVVETLAVNPPFAPLATITYPQSTATSPPLFPSSGKLGLLTDFYYATWVNWTNGDVTDGTPGSTQPIVTVTELGDLSWPVQTTPWKSARVFELLFDDGPEAGSATALFPSSENYWGCTLGPCSNVGTGAALQGGMTERRGLTIRRFMALIAPQTLENPLQNHLTASDSASIRASCTAMASVGWEMLVLSYGSGADVENLDPAYLSRMAADIAFCNALGIEVGAYDLIGWSRDPGNGWSALTPDGSDSGNACFASGWEAYLGHAFFAFANATGLTMLETDGPYAGYSCSNASHAGHAGDANAVAVQSRAMASMYARLQSAGIYLNAPDSYFTAGISKMGIGYNEGTFRLPDVDLISLIQRQVIYDATFYTIPSAAWSQLPMATYDFTSSFDLERFSAGVGGQLALGIATFIYQPPGASFLPSPAVSPILSQWASFFKANRVLLSSGDVIHVRRPDGQGVDIILHARAGADVPGLLVLTNPTPAAITTTVTVPLYYTGLAPGSAATVAWSGGANTPVQLDWRARVVLQNVTVSPRSIAWATVSAA